MNFCWIYVKDFSYYHKSGLWNELEYSIKSVKKNYKGAKCWVFGDDPGLDVNFVEVPRVVNHKSGYPQDIDVIHKFKAIAERMDEFILMYDDIYLLQPLTYEDFEITYARCKVDNIEEYKRPWSRKYRMLWQKTYRLIKDFREEVYDWECHLPRLFDSGFLDEVIDTYGCLNNPLIATSIYHACITDETVILTPDIQSNLLNTQIDNLDELFKAKFMNIMDEAITLDFKTKMTEVFGESISVKPTHRRH